MNWGRAHHGVGPNWEVLWASYNEHIIDVRQCDLLEPIEINEGILFYPVTHLS